MHSHLTSGVLLALFGWVGCALSACTNDFSSFHFVDHSAATAQDASTRTVDARAAEHLPDSALPFDAASDSAAAQSDAHGEIDAANMQTMPDATSLPIAADGGSHEAADAGGAAHPPSEAGTPNTDDAGEEDAHVPVTPPPPPTDPEICLRDWNAQQVSTSMCSGCACEQCTSPMLDCFSRGSDVDRLLCTNLFACAVKNRCHDWDCYCSSSACRMGTGEPDGPCVAEMNAAAGGDRNIVKAVHQANDPNQPLVRAVRAVGCTTGQPFSSVGGMMTGKCTQLCSP